MSGTNEEHTGKDRFGCIVVDLAIAKFALKAQNGMNADGDSELSALKKWAG